MSRFCTRCGAQSEADSGFCVNCGNRLRPAAAAATNPTVQPALRVNARRLVIPLVALAVVLIVVAGMALYLADEPASKEVFSRAVVNYYRDHPQAGDELVCLSDIAYGKDTLMIASYDEMIRRRLDILVSAGLYNPPRKIEMGSFIPMTKFEYSRTTEGNRAIRNDRLCLAKGIRIASLRYDAPNNDPTGARSRAYFTYELDDPASWLKGDLVAHARSVLRNDRERFMMLELRDRKWVALGPNTQVTSAAPMNRQGTDSASAWSWLATVRGWFGPKNPILGKWKVTSLPLLGKVENELNMQYLFAQDQATIEGRAVRVRYEVRGDDVIVSAENAREGQIFHMLDYDHMVMRIAGGEVTFDRMPD